MPSTRRNTFWRALPRKLVASGCLFSYLMVAVGFPYSAPVSSSNGERFACQSLACGCQTAEQCRVCGCFTTEERQYWERANQVKPKECCGGPDCDVCNGKAESCCKTAAPSPEEPKSFCSGASRAETKSCCDTKPAKPAPTIELRWGRVLAALKCQGLGTQWVSLGAAPLPEPRYTFTTAFNLVDFVGPRQELAFVISSTPPARPPRLGSV